MRVLVVDDEPDLLELIHYNLAKAGYDVACVLSGEEALAPIQRSLGGQALRRLPRYGSTNKYRPLTKSNASGRSGT